MSDMQEILSELMVALDEGQINAEVIEGAMKALSAVPEIYHTEAVKALLRTPQSDEEQPEEQPEDYLAVKTYTSSEFHAGDEVKSIYSGERAIILKNSEGGNNSRFYVVFSDGSSGVKEKGDWTRTGRNFPAIAAIMEELKKA